MSKPIIGRDMDEPNRPEIEHFGNCPVCGALVDMRDLGQVFAHLHGEGPTEMFDEKPS